MFVINLFSVFRTVGSGPEFHGYVFRDMLFRDKLFRDMLYRDTAVGFKYIFCILNSWLNWRIINLLPASLIERVPCAEISAQPAIKG